MPQANIRPWKSRPVFVSSTFKGMHAERDLESVVGERGVNPGSDESVATGRGDDIRSVEASSSAIHGACYGGSRPHPDADPNRAAQRNIEYQKRLAEWQALPFLRRLITKRPERPRGIGSRFWSETRGDASRLRRASLPRAMFCDASGVRQFQRSLWKPGSGFSFRRGQRHCRGAANDVAADTAWKKIPDPGRGTGTTP